MGEQVVGATCLYAGYDPVSRRCSVARAGHPPPVVTTPDGEAAPLDLSALPPLGLGGLPFEAREIELAEGCLLCLSTNGVIGERHIDADVGLTKLCAALTRPADALERTCQAVVDSLVPSRPSDDVALLIARTRLLPPDDVAFWSLPLEPASAARARELASAKLTEWGLEHLAFTTELIASELITNVYRYASGPATLRLMRERCLVRSATPATPHHTCAAPVPPTRAGAACSWWPRWPNAGVPATPVRARPCGPNNH